MNEEKKKIKKTTIKEEDIYEGKQFIDDLITSVNEIKNKIDNIHSIISNKIVKENANKNLTKEEEKKINEEFSKAFNIKINNQKKIFEYINDINQNHIKEYQNIFNSLNLNLIPNNDNNKRYEKEENKINKELKPYIIKR